MIATLQAAAPRHVCIKLFCVLLSQRGTNLLHRRHGSHEAARRIPCHAVQLGKGEEASGLAAESGEVGRTGGGPAVLNGLSHREGGEGGETLLVETSGRQTLQWRLGESGGPLRPDVDTLSSEEITGSVVDAVKGAQSAYVSL
jgi:hypothetical protein